MDAYLGFRGVAGERGLDLQHRIDEDPQRPIVYAVPVALSRYLLRRHVVRVAHHCICLCSPWELNEESGAVGCNAVERLSFRLLRQQLERCDQVKRKGDFFFAGNL